MNAWKLIARSAAYYWRTHLGVAAGAAVATAVLVGALAVGDSVRYSLRQIALRRLGDVDLALAARDRLFRARPAGQDANAQDLAAGLADELDATVAPALLLDAAAKTPDGTARANDVQVVGVDGRFWAVGGAPDPLAGETAGGEACAINTHLARQLDVGVGDRILLRVATPSGLPREAPLGSDRDTVTPIGAEVRAVVGDDAFGRFSLRTNQLAPYNVFLPMGLLQRRTGQPGRGNVLLVAAEGRSVEDATAALKARWRLADASLSLRATAADTAELRTSRVFLSEPAARAARAADADALGVLTYFVDRVWIADGDANAPYAIVAGLDPAAGPPASPVPPDLDDDEIILTDWLARDLDANVGDRVRLQYRTVGPMRTFVEAERTFRVAAGVPVNAPGLDADLMPDFPGLADVANCRDWEPGVEIDTDLIRPKDQAYWDAHGGTPKAVVTLAAAQKMWGNRFGELTAVRYARAPDDALRRRILDGLAPSAIGLFFRDVRAEAVAAAEPTSDFGGLFLGLSFFLIASAALLTGLLFVFNVEQRSGQVGLLLALGLRPWHVRGLLLGEGAVLAAAGAVAGSAAGLGYTRLVLWGLATVWQDVATSNIAYHATWASVGIGAGVGLAVAVGAMFLTLLRLGRASAAELLSAGAGGRTSRPAGRGKVALAAMLGLACAAGTAAMLAAAFTGRMAAAGAFFGAGGLLLLGDLCMTYVALARVGTGGGGAGMSLPLLALRGCGRRRWRSLATVALLACGVFLVASVEAFRLDPAAEATEKTSGTGGFALYGESAVGVLHDLNDPARRRKLGLDIPAMEDARVVGLRLAEGDDASCLNLNRARQPRLLGVQPAELDGRFGFIETLGEAPENPWRLLEGDVDGNAATVPAIGDADTLTWALHKAVGDTLTVTDARGEEVTLRIVGKIGGSILQGSLLIGEESFRRLFPATGGHRVFLVDAPRAARGDVRAELSRVLEDQGLALMPATVRLAQFAEVQNTYLSIFAALGGLGLVLGTVAIGIVVLRNVLERRGELALLRAVGFPRARIRRLVLIEHWALLAMGLMAGVGSAVVAVVPSLIGPAAEVPWRSWLTILAAIAISGVAWTWLAAAAALRGELLPALRRE